MSTYHIKKNFSSGKSQKKISFSHFMYAIYVPIFVMFKECRYKELYGNVPCFDWGKSVIFLWRQAGSNLEEYLQCRIFERNFFMTQA